MQSLGLFVPCVMIVLGLGGCAKNPTSPAEAPNAVTSGTSTSSASPDLQTQIDEALAFTAERELSAETNAAWQVVHGIVAYGHDLKMRTADGGSVSALAHLLEGGQLRGWKLQAGEKGLFAPVESGSTEGQGHPDQWLGYFSQVGLPVTQTIKLGDKSYTLEDMLHQAQWDIYQGMEASWTLMALAAYLPSDAKWTAKDGAEWSTERVVAMEAAQPLSMESCGSSHRMVALATALNARKAEGLPITGGWQKAEEKVADGLRRCREFQQPGGAFSANYFERSAAPGDLSAQFQTTGHLLEFVVLASSPEQLAEPWVERAVAALCKMFRLTRNSDAECGWLYHGARSLKLYRQRRYGESAPASVARDPQAEPADTTTQ